MPDFRDHSAVVIEDFNGLWHRGDDDSVPADHFSSCNNVKFSQSSFSWRSGLTPYLPFANIVRVYTFVKPIGQSLICLDTDGNFWDTDYPDNPILTVANATDFAFSGYSTRCYISPSDVNAGLLNDFLYVYLGDGTPARKAAGAKPTDTDGALAAANSGSAGNVEAGIHVFAVVYETDTGFLTAIGPDTLPTVTAPGGEAVNLTNIPTSPNSYVTKVHVIATKAINPDFYTGNTTGYQFFFVPGAVVNNATTTLSVSFFDNELLEDASYLLDMFEEIPAFLGLTTYHGRLVGWAEGENPTVMRISVAGEPEAINQVDGLVVFPSNVYFNNACEYRDVLYGFGVTQTVGWADNGDVPSSWKPQPVDQGLGAHPHTVATVLDSNGVTAEFVLIANLSGLYLFNGAYQNPELSWKIRDTWLALDLFNFYKNQLVNDSINQCLYFVLNDGTVLYADYSNGLNHKDIRWTPWTFDVFVTSMCIHDQKQLTIASNGLA
mgnify:CR=1 FL=1